MFYCGIDVAKQKHAVVVMNDHGQTHQPVFTIRNTREGLEFLAEALQRAASSRCFSP
jgi:transposase